MAMKGRGAPLLWISLRPRTTGIRPWLKLQTVLDQLIKIQIFFPEAQDKRS